MNKNTEWRKNGAAAKRSDNGTNQQKNERTQGGSAGWTDKRWDGVQENWKGGRIPRQEYMGTEWRTNCEIEHSSINGMAEQVDKIVNWQRIGITGSGSYGTFEEIIAGSRKV